MAPDTEQDAFGLCVTCWHFSMLLNSLDLVYLQRFNKCWVPQARLTLFSELWEKSSTPDPIYLISHSPNITSSTWGFLLPLRETSFICKLFAVPNRYCSMAFQLNKISTYCVIHWAPDVTPIGKKDIEIGTLIKRADDMIISEDGRKYLTIVQEE